MSVRFLVGLPAAFLAVAPVLGVIGTPVAQAAQWQYSCTAQTWSGDTLPTITVEAKTGTHQAKGEAQTQWGGTAKYATIVCTPA